MKTNQTNNQVGSGTIFTGVLLVLIGLGFLLTTLGLGALDWGNMWPVFPIMVGASLLVQAFLEEASRRAAPVMGGTILILLGVFFFATTLDFVTWSDQERLWPVYLLIVGIAAFVAYLASGMEKTGHLITAGVTTLAGGVLLAATLYDSRWTWLTSIDFDSFLGYGWARTWWPLAPMAIGLFLLGLAVTAKTHVGRAMLVLWGTIPLLTGIFFQATTLGYITWEDQGQLWPLYPLIVSVAFLGAYLASGHDQNSYLVPAGILGTVGVVFMGQTMTGYGLIADLWPLALIIVGVLLLYGQSHRPHNTGRGI